MKAQKCIRCSRARLVHETDLSGRCSDRVEWLRCPVCGELQLIDAPRRCATEDDRSPAPVFNSRKAFMS